jgi:hypothetical protein
MLRGPLAGEGDWARRLHGCAPEAVTRTLPREWVLHPEKLSSIVTDVVVVD